MVGASDRFCFVEEGTFVKLLTVGPICVLVTLDCMLPFDIYSPKVCDGCSL